jgi:ubiquitin thioesterase OTU1
VLTEPPKEKNLIQFGEGKSSRCILVYSGVHYDRVAFSFSDPPYKESTLPPELDTTIWDVEDQEILVKTHELVEALHKIHYYTDTNEILLRCEAPGCEWIGSGEREGRKHAEKTGHTKLTEVEDNSLLKCNDPNCDWLGSGEKEASQHRSDTGHTSWSVIPDF